MINDCMCVFFAWYGENVFNLLSQTLMNERICGVAVDPQNREF